MLAAFIHPNHIAYLCSWGLTHLPPTCNSKLFGYMPPCSHRHECSISGCLVASSLQVGVEPYQEGRS
ncbi:hypothetical protein DM784_06220 [Vibrio furnissii]|nr:hypothetical protein DM784_06220 [Vibrio furnissii]